MSNLKITDLNAAMAHVLGFQTKKELINFIKNHNVNVKKPFDSLNLDILKIKNSNDELNRIKDQRLKFIKERKVQRQQQLNEILEMEKLRKNERQQQLNEILEMETFLKNKRQRQFNEILEMERLRKAELKKKNIERVREKIMEGKRKLLKRQQQQFNEILEMERLRKIKKSSDAIHLTVSYLIYSPLNEESDNIDKRKIITDKFGNKHYLKYSGSVNTTDNIIVKKYI